MLLVAGTANAEEQTLKILDDSMVAVRGINCTLTTTENGLEVATTGQGQDSLIDFDFSKTPMAGPVALEFSMQTNVRGDLGEYIVYWVNEQEVSWRKFRRVLFRPDGKSHTYRLPLAASGRVRAVRFSLGKQKHRVSLSAMKLAPITSSPPEPKSELLNQITINNESLFLDLDAKEHVYKITDKVTNRTWRSEPVSKWLVLKRVEQTDPNILQVTMFDRFAKQPLTAHIELASDSTVKFSLDAATSQSPIAAANYPPRFSTDMSAGKFVFCDRSCGVLLDQKDPTYADWPLRVYGNTHCLDMPWVGLFDEQLRDGMMVVVDTPTDAEVAFVQHEDGRHWPEVRWLPALDSFGYRRSVSLKFTSGGGYVEFARKYREDLKRQGRFRTLADKAKYKPKVSLLRGAPSIWGGDDAESFIRALSPLGIDRGIVSNCKDAKTVAWLNNLGYLTGRYDSYTDILEGETNFQRDNIKQTSVISRPGGKPKLGWKLRRGKQMYWRSSACWKAAEQAYTPAQLEEVPYNARFVDVAAAADLLEDFHPEHMFDRRQDLANRRELYQTMNQYGLVLGTEHGNDWIVDQVEYFEGTMSGPFWWSSWPAGYLDRPSRDQLTDKYLKFGIGFAHRVPLWELVYHDCAITTWYWGDTAGMLYEAAPELSDRKDLFNILYGTIPLFWTSGKGYKLPEDQHRLLQTYHDTCQLHKVVAFEQLVSHEFLTADCSVQKTKFSNGTTVVVNFADAPQPLEVDGKKVMLGPRGYFVEGPQFSQTRIVENDNLRTVIKAPNYLTVESNGEQTVEYVRCRGRLTTFRTDDDRWNLFLTPDRACELNIVEITGWSLNDDLAVRQMDEHGNLGDTVAPADESGIVRFRSTSDSWRFALVRNAVPPKVATNRGGTQ